MLNKTIADLEPGDVFEPVRYVLTSFMCAVYAHGVEETAECYYSDANPYGRQLRPPTMVHVDKLRLLEANCDEERRIAGMRAEAARIHYEYSAVHHSPAFVGEEIVVSGRITDKYVKRGRRFLAYEIRIETADGRLVTTYDDITLLDYAKVEEAAA
ncbi:FAS1-like dehydratase domain-containing protein [Microbacterium ulmi]|uniref:FAS1-like dehydratase domain-containing protein n=1 Tax=Microbacterium ulmi TaxID=179095 RepID=A0A7Y2M2G2_9MICO|nr:hypothetical protein [Microbacterium ulmi]